MWIDVQSRAALRRLNPEWPSLRTVGDAGHRPEQRDDDLIERLDPLEKSEDAEGAKHLELREGAERHSCKSQQADGHDDKVESIPATRPKPETDRGSVLADE